MAPPNCRKTGKHRPTAYPKNLFHKADEGQSKVPSFWLGLLDRWWCHLLRWKTLTSEEEELSGSQLHIQIWSPGLEITQMVVDAMN